MTPTTTAAPTPTPTPTRWRSRVVVFALLILLTVFILLRELTAFTAYWDIIDHLQRYFKINAKTAKTMLRFNKYNTTLVHNATSNTTTILFGHEKKNEIKYIQSFTSPSSIESWSPFIVNENCPIFVVESDHGYGGFGDQFERYAHLLNIARLLKATAVSIFTNSGQVGSSDYIKMAQLMNINLNLQHEYKKYNISHHFSFRSLDEVEKIHSEILSNNGSSPSLPCHSVVRVNMYDCSGTWCSFVLKEIHEVKWILRNNSFVSHCAKNKMGFRRQRGKVNLLWHVRSGDLCIRCKDTQYFDSLLQMIHSAVQSRAQTMLHFESSAQLSEIMTHFGSNASFFVNRPIIESVCRMMTADILITSGSSLAYVAAISKAQLPLVMEEMRKEAQPQFHGTFGGGSSIPQSLQHVFNEDEAVLLSNGKPIVPLWKFNHRLVATLSDLFIEDRRRRIQ